MKNLNRYFMIGAVLSVGLAACSNSQEEDHFRNDTPDSGADSGTQPPPPDDIRVVLNEVSSSGDDQVEIFNAGEKALDLGGWFIMDSKKDLPTAFTIAQGTTLEAGGYLVLKKGVHHSFGLGAEDGVSLFYPDGTLMDETSWAAGDAEGSWCRMPNGSGDFQVCSQQTFGRENSDAASECGNGVIEGPGERCDGELLDGKSCAEFGFTEGQLSCSSDCKTFDTSACSGRTSPIVINEVTASGADQIELFNTGGAEVDLSGFKVTDDNTARADAYIFPEGNKLAGGAYLVLEKDVHHSFGIGGKDEVHLFDAAGEVVDSTGWSEGEAATSWCRIPNGSGPFQSCSEQTFGAMNQNADAACGDGKLHPTEACDGELLNGASCGSQGFASGALTCAADCKSFDTSACVPLAPSVVINEVSSSGDDLIELYNAGSAEVDLSGFKVTDDNTARADAYIFPEGTKLPGGAYLVLEKDVHHSFGIGGKDEVHLFDPSGATISWTAWAEGEALTSWCRIPNGSGPFQSCSDQTFGAENSHQEPSCGDGVIQPAEACDGALLNGASCESEGFASGSLTCAADCKSFDTSACVPLAPSVVINEVTSSGDDLIELYNAGSAEADLSGWKVTDDDTARADAYIFPVDTKLAVGAYMVLKKGEHHSFGLGGADEVHLFDPSGATIDWTGWASGDAATSWCRLPNGSGAFQVCVAQTFDDTNQAPSGALFEHRSGMQAKLASGGAEGYPGFFAALFRRGFGLGSSSSSWLRRGFIF